METIEIQAALQPPVISKKIPFNLTSFKGINEYLLIVGPNGGIRRTIEQGKKEFGSNYQNDAATYGQPHITLANYIQPDVTEETILEQLEIIGKEANKIKVVLNNYRWFEPHTILYALQHSRAFYFDESKF